MCFKKLLFVISLTSLLIMICSCKSAIKDDADSSTNVASEEESSLNIIANVGALSPRLCFI